MAETIRNGGALTYDSHDLERLRKQYELIASVPRSAVWGALFRFFLPSILFLGGLFLILAVLKNLKK